MSPKELLEKLKLNVSNKKRLTLDVIYEICIEQVERGTPDFSVATISRLGYNRGAPKAQSIRNQAGEHYRALLKAFADQHSPVGKQLSKTKRVDDWITEIKDPKLKLLVQIQASELAKAKTLIKEIIPPGLEIYIDDRGTAKAEHRLSKIERGALEYCLDDLFLLDNGFKLGKYGDVLNSDGSKVFKPGTLDAMKKALGYL